MNERLTKCPLCKSGLFLNHQLVEDHSVSGEKFILCQCKNCSLIFTNPRPDENSIMKYYDSEDYISHQDNSNTLINVIYKTVRKYTLKSKISWINEHTNIPGRILDYGCGTGYFLQAAKKKGWSCFGIEPNQIARQKARDFGLTVFENINQIKKEKKFDAITLFHVLEHIHSLTKTLQNIIKQLKNSGTLFLAVPNVESFDATFYKEEWAGLDVPRHLYHFTQTSMHILAEEMSLKIIDQKPMVFDSYYVSMLSEKYKNKESNKLISLLYAISTGLKSNKWARNNKKNYSSILFILKKK